jgi:hypothetical protein
MRKTSDFKRLSNWKSKYLIKQLRTFKVMEALLIIIRVLIRIQPLPFVGLWSRLTLLGCLAIVLYPVKPADDADVVRYYNFSREFDR